MDAGELVSDEIVLGLIRERLQRADTDDPLFTCGDVRHRIQAEHRLNLLHWLYVQFHSGAMRLHQTQKGSALLGRLTKTL